MKQILLLIRKEWTENARYILYFFPFFTGVYISLVAYACYEGYKDTMRYNYLFFSIDTFFTPLVIGLFLSGIFAIYWGSRSWLRKEKAIYSLTLPASNLQKWFCLFLMYSVLFYLTMIVWTTLLLYLTNTFVNSLDFIKEYGGINFLKTTASTDATTNGVFIFLFIQAPFYVGLFHFKKNGVIKTLITLVVVSFLLYHFTTSIGDFLGAYTEIFPNSRLGLKIDEDDYYEIYENTKMTNRLFSSYFILIIIALFTASYFKFKERQVR